MDIKTPSELKKLSDQELLNLHQKLHSLYWTLIREDLETLDGTTREDLANQHVYVVDEIEDRKLKHPPVTNDEDDLDKVSETISKIEDAINYNVLKPDDEQLRDDWRIVCAWYASIQQGKTFKYTESQIINLSVKIMKEIVRRKIAEFSPDKMTKYARDLFERVQNILRKKGIKIPVKKLEIILSDMRLEFLGTKGEIEELPTGHKKHSVLKITAGGKSLLIDFGKDWKGKIDEVKHDAVLITHSHPDHILGIEGYKNPVYTPKRCIRTTPANLKDINFKILPTEVWYKIEGIPNISVKGIPVTHSIKAPMTGYLIKSGKNTIGYFPDVLHIKDYENVLKDLDVYIGDAATPHRDLVRRDVTNDEPYGHRSMQGQLEWCEKAGVKKVIFTHFGKWSEETKEEDFKFDGTFIFAKDGMTTTIGKSDDESTLSELTKFIIEFKKTFIKPNKPAKRIYKPDEVKDLSYKKVLVQKKFDGVRMQIIKTESGEVQFRTEDQGLDKTSRLPPQEKEVKSWPQKDFILDGEAVMREGTTPLHRTEVTGFINGKGPTDKASNLFIKIFDCMKYDGKDITDEPLTERLKYMNKFSNLAHIDFCSTEDGKIVPISEAPKLIKEIMKKPFSEGAMIKDVTSKYRTDSIHNLGWVKIKRLLEIDCIVLEAIKNKTGYYNYLCGIGPIPKEHADALKSNGIKFKNVYFAVLGKTFTEKETVAKAGDIIRVGVSEIKKEKVPDTDFYRYNFQDPNVIEKIPERHSPDGIAVADKLAEQTKPEASKIEEEDTGDEGETRGEISAAKWKDNWFKAFPKSGKGEFVYQRHWRGLKEEESDFSEEKLFNTQHSVHGDLRMSSAEEWGDLWGATIFLGETKDAKDRLISLPKDDALQITFKLPQPKGWLNIGVDEPYVGKPGSVGATTKGWTKLFVIDKGIYRIGVWREHAFEIFLNGDKLKGRFIIQYAPMEEGKRVWLIKQPDNQTPYAESHDKDKVIDELKTKKQRYLVWCKPDEKPDLIDISKIAKDKCDLCFQAIGRDQGAWVPLLPTGKMIYIHRFGCPEVNPTELRKQAEDCANLLFYDLMSLAKYGVKND